MLVILKQVMTTNVVTVGMDTTLREIRDTFEKHTFHHLLVVSAASLSVSFPIAIY